MKDIQFWWRCVCVCVCTCVRVYFLSHTHTHTHACLHPLTNTHEQITTTMKHATGECPEHYLTAEKAKQEITTEARVYGGIYLSLLAASLALPAFGN